MNGFKRGLFLLALNQAQDVLVQHVLAEVRWNGADELIAAQDAFDVAIVEDVLGSRQAQRRSGDAHLETRGGRLLAVVNLPAARWRVSANRRPSSLYPLPFVGVDDAVTAGGTVAASGIGSVSFAGVAMADCEDAGFAGTSTAASVSPRPSPAAYMAHSA